MHKRILWLLTATLTLTACASGSQPTTTPRLTPPQSAMQACPALLPPMSGQMTDLLANHLAVAQAYHQCRDRHWGLIQWIDETDKARRGE